MAGERAVSKRCACGAWLYFQTDGMGLVSEEPHVCRPKPVHAYEPPGKLPPTYVPVGARQCSQCARQYRAGQTKLPLCPACKREHGQMLARQRNRRTIAQRTEARKAARLHSVLAYCRECAIELPGRSRTNRLCPTCAKRRASVKGRAQYVARLQNLSAHG